MTLRVGVLSVVACLVASAARADWEIAVHGGPTFPFYEQSFEFDPGPRSGPWGRSSARKACTGSTARGGISLGAALAFHPHSALGLELRLDTADVDVRTGGVSYQLRVAVPPVGNITADVAFTEGVGDLERLRPVSLNLRVRSPGTTRVTVSGGVSYLPVVPLPHPAAHRGERGRRAAGRGRRDPASRGGRFRRRRATGAGVSTEASACSTASARGCGSRPTGATSTSNDRPARTGASRRERAR